MTNFRRTHIRHSLTGAGLTALAMAVGTALAPAAWAQDEGADPPTRVGRIAIIEGTVSFHPSPDDPWAAAAVNYPIAQAGQLWVEPGGRAEIGLGEARIRIDGGTELDIVQFDDQNVVLSVPQGRVDLYLHGRHPEEQYIVETPRGNVNVSDDGHYRFVAGSSGDPTRVASFTGLANIAEPQTQLTINHGEEAVISPTDPPTFQVSQAAEDPFDHWGEDRERRVTEGASYRYVSPDMPGAADLDQYGSWRDNPEYGHVWFPSAVEAGWAPYHHGHWASVAPWGWTWVDDAPWGFAPFHYGRWAEFEGRWGWVPGEVAVHPVYAPALVAWVGDPSALVGGVAIGGVGVSVGWLPLGPREVWVPPYHTSIDYVRASNIAYVPRNVVENISVTNITVIHNNTTFVNQRAVTVVPHEAFASAQPVQRAALTVQPAAFSHPIAVAPTPSKVLPPPTPAAHIASPLHPASAPPAASMPLSHPLAPSNNLPKLAPAAAGPHAPAPTPVPTVHPGPIAPSAMPVPHPGSTPGPTPTPGAVPGPHPIAPLTPAAPPHPGPTPGPTPTPGAVPGPHPIAPPAPQVQPHPGLPPAPPPAPELHAPATQPQQQYHPPAPPPPAPSPQIHAPVAQPQPQQQYHPPAPPPPAPLPQIHAPAPQPQVHAPAPPPPAALPHPAPQAAHPAAPPPPPKKDDKDNDHH